MNNQTWSQNPIVQAYEKNFALLEAARKEYEQDAFSLLEEVKERTQEYLVAASLGEGLKLETVPVDAGFCRRQYAFKFLMNGILGPLQVITRLATPWGGSSGCLQIAAVAYLDGKSAAHTVESLREVIRIDDEFGRSCNGKRMHGVDPNWLLGVELEITSNIGDRAGNFIATLLRGLSPLASSLDEDRRLSESMLQLLKNVLQRLKLANPYGNGWSLLANNGWWEGMHFIQLFCPDRRAFWIGYHVRNQCFMYGHHVREEDPTFAKRFFLEAKAKLPDYHAGNPAGVVMERDEIMQKSGPDIEKFVSDLFQLFYDKVIGSAQLPVALTPSAGPEHV